MLENPPIHLFDRYAAYMAMPHPLQILNTSKDPWSTCLALISAAHCTDAAVNKMLPNFLKVYPDYKSVAGKTKEDLIPLLPGISHSGNKAEYILNWAKYLNDSNGMADMSIAALTKVKGIGRKTAGILQFTVSGIDEALPLDVHCLRILDRLDWFKPTKNADVREKQLLPLIPIGKRFQTFTILTQHGRHVCGALQPKCSVCLFKDVCAFQLNRALFHN